MNVTEVEEFLRKELEKFCETYPIEGAEFTNVKLEGDVLTGVLKLPVIPPYYENVVDDEQS